MSSDSLQRHHNSAQAGFTLIELVVVIVILGILAATALPKFASMQGDARGAALKGARGAVASALNMAHAKKLVSTTAPATIEGAAVTFVNDYPNAATISGLAGLSADYSTDVSGSVAKVFVVAASSTSSCNFSYTEAASSIAAPVLAVASTTGC